MIDRGMDRQKEDRAMDRQREDRGMDRQTEDKGTRQRELRGGVAWLPDL